MLEACRNADLPMEALRTECSSQFRPQDFDSHLAGVSRVYRPEDQSHAPTPDFLPDFVASLKIGAQLRYEFVLLPSCRPADPVHCHAGSLCIHETPSRRSRSSNCLARSGLPARSAIRARTDSTFGKASNTERIGVSSSMAAILSASA